MVKMNIDYYAKLWHQQDPDLNLIQKLWDARAKDFNRHKNRATGKKKIDTVINFLTSQKMLHQDSEVLDIGCGSGNYTLALAKVAKNVVGIDISPNMIRHAQENTNRAGIKNISFLVTPWEDIILKEKGWVKKFDLVFASMCPGINSKASLLKMLEASRGFCFLSSFAQREDSVGDALFSMLYGQAPGNKWSKKIYCIFNILWLLGYFPNLSYHDTEWTQQWELEKATELFSLKLARGRQLDAGQIKKITNYLENIAQDGVIQESVAARVAWLYWQV